MLYAYAPPSRFSPEGKIGLFQATTKTEGGEAGEQEHLLRGSHEAIGYDTVLGDSDASAHSAGTDVGIDTVSKGTGEHDNKAQVMSSLSITLTALSIIVALRYAHNDNGSYAEVQYLYHRDNEFDWREMPIVQGCRRS